MLKEETKKKKKNPCKDTVFKEIYDVFKKSYTVLNEPYIVLKERDRYTDLYCVERELYCFKRVVYCLKRDVYFSWKRETDVETYIVSKERDIVLKEP